MNQYTHRDGAQEIQISKSCFCSSTLCLTCSTRSTISRGMTSGLSSRPSRCCRRAPTSTPWNVIPESTTRPRPKSLGTEDHSGPGTIHDEAGHGFLLVFDTYRVYLILMFVLIESFYICLYLLVLNVLPCICLNWRKDSNKIQTRYEQITNQIRTESKPIQTVCIKYVPYVFNTSKYVHQDIVWNEMYLYVMDWICLDLNGDHPISICISLYSGPNTN